MEQTNTNSNRKVYIGVSVVLVLVVAIAVTAYVMLGTTKKAPVAKTTTTSKPTVATKSQVQQNLAALDVVMKQASADQAAAKTAISQGVSQEKAAN